MSYVTSPYAPAARKRAANLVLTHGYTKAQAARVTGVHRSTIATWVEKARRTNQGLVGIPTESSRPHHSPQATSPMVVARIVTLRRAHGRCAPAIHAQLRREGISVSEKTVQRTIRRQGLAKPLSKWRRAWTPPIKRPWPLAPGALVQMDVVHLTRPDDSRYYLYTVLDVYSRWAYAEYRPRLSQRESLAVIMAAQTEAGFAFSMIQTDNGPEFGKWFHQMLIARGLRLRHSRVRTPNDNAHLERFNRTIQDECITRYRVREEQTAEAVEKYLMYYNTERLHAGIDYQTPSEIVAKVLS